MSGCVFLIENINKRKKSSEEQKHQGFLDIPNSVVGLQPGGQVSICQ
jgi:hypothetical protein